QALANSPLTWSLLSDASVGTVVASSASTNDKGEAEAKVTLANGTTQVLLQVCVTGKTTGCSTFALKNATAFVAQPAQQSTAAANASAVASTRLQLTQIRTRFQQLRNEQAGGFSNGVGVSGGGVRVPTGGSSSSGEASSTGSSTSSSSAGTGSTERDINADGVRGSKWGAFSLGDIDISRVNDGSGGRTKLSTQGLTVGVDYRATPSFVVGAALGGLRGKAETFGNGEQRAKGVSGSIFGQWFSPGQFYANAIVNYGRNSYDLKRFGLDAARIDSNTDSKQRAFQFEGGYNFTRDRFSVSPYLRVEQVRAALGAIRETGHLDAIEISASKLRANTFAFGVQADARFSTSNGVWIPGLRVEYLSEKQKQSDAFAQLINGTPVIVPVPVAPYDNRYGSVGLTLQWLTGIAAQPISVFLGFDTTFGQSGVSTKRYTAGLKVPL
ncbi:MAG: autotransporter outer membrane beta-barrel domain-containing protein, partial [Casimicrobium sp.]